MRLCWPLKTAKGPKPSIPQHRCANAANARWLICRGAILANPPEDAAENRDWGDPNTVWRSCD